MCSICNITIGDIFLNTYKTKGNKVKKTNLQRKLKDQREKKLQFQNTTTA